MKINVNNLDKCKSEKYKYFTQICTEEFIELPCSHPDIEQVVSVVVDCEIVSIRVINTMRGLSYEGQHLTGKMLALELKLCQKVLYVADKHSQSVHIFENYFYQNAYIVIPCFIEGTDPEFLVKHKILQCKVEVEDVLIKNIDNRKVFKTLCLFINAFLSPTYELCCSIHFDCRYSNIFIMHADGTHTVGITSCEDYIKYKPLWSPSGREISFITDYYSKKVFNIYSYRTCSTKQLTTTSVFKSFSSYCWSSDGTKIIFSGIVKDNREIYSISPYDTDLKQLTFGNGMYENFKPKCSPCGQEIAFIRSSSGVADIWIMNLEGLNCRKLTTCGCIKHFDWSPDSKEILYVCSKNESSDQIYIINLECMKNEELQIKAPVPCKKKVQYSPDGTSFAFIGSHLDSDDIYLYNFTHRKIENVTNNCDNVKISDYVWSADSDCIYLSAKTFQYFSIFMVSVEGKQKIQLTNTNASKIELAYRPRIC